MQRSNRGQFSSKIYYFKMPFSFKKKKSVIKNKQTNKTVNLWSRPNEMLSDKYHELFSRQWKVKAKGANFLPNAQYFLFIWGKEALARPAAVSLLNQKFLRARKEGIDSVTNSITSKGKSPWTSWEVLSSSCHRRHGNEGVLSASYLCFSVSLQTKSFTGNVSKCRTHVSLPILQ